MTELKTYRPLYERIQLIEKMLPCRRILDAGCGDGIYFPYLSRKADEVVGLDFSSDRLMRIKNLDAFLVRGDVRALPFRNEAFEIVWASEVVEHTSSFEVFQELERVAKDCIIATLPNPHGPYYGRDPGHVLKFEIDALKQFLEKREWCYSIMGLGMCLPYTFIPRFVRAVFLRLTWNHPKLAWNFSVLGYREPKRKNRSLQ